MKLHLDGFDNNLIAVHFASDRNLVAFVALDHFRVGDRHDMIADDKHGVLTALNASLRALGIGFGARGVLRATLLVADNTGPRFREHRGREKQTCNDNFFHKLELQLRR